MTSTAYQQKVVFPYQQFAKAAGVREDLADPGVVATSAEMRTAMALISDAAVKTIHPYDFSDVEPMPSNQKWAFVSAIQKEVRRGKPESAARYMAAMIKGGEAQYVWKRMNVIAAEDIGIGSVIGTLIVLHICSFKTFRDHYDPKQLVSAVCYILSVVTKSRDMTDTFLYSTSQAPTKDKTVSTIITQKDAYALLMSKELSLEQQLQLWARIRDAGSFPTAIEWRDNLYYEYGLPPLFVYLIERTKKSSGHDLGCGIPVLYDYLIGATHIGEQPDMFPPKEAPLIGGVPAYAYDMHVFQGKSSITYFAKANQPMKDWIKSELGYEYDPNDEMNMNWRKRALSYALFWAEGGTLDRRLVFDGWQDLFDRTRKAEGSHAGVPAERWDEMCGVMYDQLDAMHGYRKRIVEK